MKRNALPLFIAIYLLASCSTSPEKTFGIAGLNCNMLYGFAGNGMQREMASPSVKLVDEKTLATAPMTRKEFIDEKIKNLKENYEKVKDISTNDENKEMLNASKALYEFALPVYKKEYIEVAALYDGNAAKEKIEAAEKNISDKYEARFNELYNTAIEKSTAYAEKHGIQVRTVNPSPRL